MGEAEPSEGDVIQLSIRWEDPTNAPLVYPTNLIVQHTPHEFNLIFYEAAPPLLVGESEAEKREQLKQMDNTIVAKPVVRVVIAAGRMEEFLKSLTDNYAKYRVNAKAILEARARAASKKEQQS